MTEQTMVSGRFVIQRKLGTGGMGVVFEVFDRERQQVVAMKKLLQQDPAALIRLKKEFRSLADVVHPNLIPLYELIADGPEWFFIMELIDGVDFTAYLAVAGPGGGGHESMAETERLGDDFDPATDAIPYDPYAPPPASVSYAGAPGAARLQRLRSAVRQLAAGVVALHDAGKMHRDLKPSNVLVRPNGHVVILDFGLVADFDPQSNRPLTLAGTPAYMSPEQIQRLPITPASDWYAVGVMLYEALTGRLPFDGNPFAVTLQKQSSEPVPPRAIVPEIPQDLSDLCLALLARQPEDRPHGRDVLLRLGEGEVRPSARPATRDAPFVGREREMRELFRAAGVLRDSRPATVLLHGRSGIGKTALVQHFLAELQVQDGDTVVLRGRCYEQESVPYTEV